MNLHSKRALLCAMVATWLLPVAGLNAQSTAPRQPQFVYVLRLAPTLHDPKAWTERENAAVSRHFQRLVQATAAGQVILAGRSTASPSETFGLVIFEAEDVDSARRFMQEDPAVVAGVMTATLHPYSVALLRKPRAE